MRKPRPIGPLSSLTQSQRQQLHDWYASFSYEQIQVRIALPPPDGFGLTVSPWQLRRYFQRLSLDDPAASSDAPSISSIIDQAALGENVFTPATIHLLEKRAFELTLAGEDPASIREVFGLVLKSRDITTRERLTEVQKTEIALRRELEQFKLQQQSAVPAMPLPFPADATSSSIPL